MPNFRLASHHIVGATVALACSLVVGCGSGGGGGGYSGGGGGPPAQPAYVNGTTTGQYTNNDVGFYLGARTNPSTPAAATPAPKLVFDVGNGFSTTITNVHWRVLQDGVAFSSGTIPTIAAFDWEDIEVPITAGAGTHVYRIELDDNAAFTETNENNNYVELNVGIAASG